MELRMLEYFVAVAREQNITAAARMLHITQPTLSRQLARLEEELGTPLFVRGKRKTTLTEGGALLLGRAQEILDLAGKAEAELRADAVGGEVYIGGGETQGMRLVARLVRRLRQTHPLLRFHLYSGNADDVCERLDRGLLDFGVLIEPVRLEKYASIRLPAADSWGLLVPQGHSLAARTGVQPADLQGLPLIASRQSQVETALAGWLGKESAGLDIVAWYNLVYNASLLVDEGVGCALCLAGLVDMGAGSGLRFLPLEPRLEAGLHIVWKKKPVFSRAARVFLTALQEEFGQNQ